MVVDDEELQLEAKTVTPACDPHRRFDIGHKALARGLLGCLAEGVLISLWKGIEMSFDRQLQAAVDIHQAALYPVPRPRKPPTISPHYPVGRAWRR